MVDMLVCDGWHVMMSFDFFSCEADEGEKLRYLKKVEHDVREQWEDKHVYESSPEIGKEKFFANFPYPYMNGALHLGHVFAFSKVEFFVRFQRMQGKNVLLPFSFHCTGMPIQASADKLKCEIEEFGNPPIFPEGKHGGSKFQWSIMEGMGLSHSEIADFANAEHWIQTFVPRAKEDLSNFGACIDWRRSFITTDGNPYYDSFVRWQFTKLQDCGKIFEGKRFTIWSSKDGQPCQDHDRSSGEGVGAVEYTMIKLKVVVVPECLKKIKDYEQKTFFLAAGTLRPETMYGLTNCWIKPSEKYGVFDVDGCNVVVCSDHSARNMIQQEIDGKRPLMERLGSVLGQDLVGTPIRLPNTFYPQVFVLPMLSISMNKASGIVVSVPSDSPDDWQNFLELKESAVLRQSLLVRDEWVLPFEVVPIIRVPTLGDLSAQAACEKMGVKDAKDAASLLAAKELVYKLGFHQGVLLAGEHKGKCVADVRVTIRDDLVREKHAFLYAEPESHVVSRSGDVCVVALTDQWFINYGEVEWKRDVLKHLQCNVETYFEECKNGLVSGVKALESWPCSRTYGLGTRLPWDPKSLIDSLSDSTIYMAYYTIAHFIQGDPSGHTMGSAGIAASQMTFEVWEFIFCGGMFPANCTISQETLEKLRGEFCYWYPWDMRCSGKDLIANHLAMSLFNHAAIFPRRHWPVGIRATGHVQLNGDKMAKSTGNFLTLQEGLKKFGSDAMRLTLARCGDLIDDGNFEEAQAAAAVLSLHSLITWAENQGNTGFSGREGDMNFFDRAVSNQINMCTTAAREEYQKTFFRNGVERGFQALLNYWKEYVGFVGSLGGVHREILVAYLESQAVMLAPVCPHVAEHLWATLKKPGLIVLTQWPASVAIDVELQSKYAYLSSVIARARHQCERVSSPCKVQVICCSTTPEWQKRLERIVKSELKIRRDADLGSLIKLVSLDDELKLVGKRAAKTFPGLVESVMAGQSFDGLSFSEHSFLLSMSGLMEKKLGAKVEIFDAHDAFCPQTKTKPYPGNPTFKIQPLE